MTILIVDGDSRRRRALQRAMQGETRTSSSPRDGLLQAELWQPSVIIVADRFHDEDESGIEIVPRLLARAPRSQVIVIADVRNPDDEETALDIGAFSYVSGNDSSLLRGVVRAARGRVRESFVAVSSRLQ
jgi:DNA-binding NarL/FixJ family response regulator